MSDMQVTKDLNNKTLILEHEFDAPANRLWRAYSDKAWFEKWWGPEGWQTTATEFDFQIGGRIHYGMKCIDERQKEWYGKSSWGVMMIEDIDEPDSFEYNDYFSDEAGMLNTDMPILAVTVEFVGLDESRSKLVIRSVADSAEEVEELLKMGMLEGYESQMNKLEELLES